MMLQVIPAAVSLWSIYTKDCVQLMLETLTGNKRYVRYMYYNE